MPKVLLTVTETVTSTINVVVECDDTTGLKAIHDAAKEAAANTSGWDQAHAEMHAVIAEPLPEDYDGPVDAVIKA